MKLSFQSPVPAATVLLTAAAILAGMAAKSPQGQQDSAGSPLPPPRTFPIPTNLKVLPKDLTGQQVHEIMVQWEASLGIRCGSCHAEDPGNLDSDGRPRLNFAGDSKPMKGVARTMYLMTEEINKSYVAKIESSGAPVTCGTCHRGHLGPEPFVIAPDDGSRASQGPLSH